MIIDKQMLATTMLATSGSQIVFNDISIPLFGVPLTVITMAAGGALASFAYGEPITSRKKLYILAAVNTFLASVAVGVFPTMLGWAWASPKIAPPLAALIAALCRFAVPAIVEMVPELLRKIFRLDKKEKEIKDEEVSK